MAASYLAAGDFESEFVVTLRRVAVKDHCYLLKPWAIVSSTRAQTQNERQNMPPAARKIFGSLLILVMMGVYALLATAFATANLADSGAFVHLVYFLFTGLLWIIPAMFIIKWMLKGQH